MKAPRTSRVGKARWYSVAAVVIAGLFAASVSATEPESIDADAAPQLARGWSALYNNEPNAAVKAIEHLTRSGEAAIRWHALHIQARSLWAMDDRESQRQALGIWTQIGNECRGNVFAAARVEIAGALHQASRGQIRQAIDALEKVVQRELRSAASIEAGIELAVRYAEADRLDDAIAQLDAADKLLEHAQSIGLSDGLRDAFALGVREARYSVRNPGRSSFERAKGMQREGRHAHAIRQFSQIASDHPDSDYGLRSQLEIGHSQLAIGRVQPAIDQWREFIAAAPAGPWRGQAFVALIDVYLDELLEMDEAARFAELARSTFPVASANDRAAESWQSVAYDIHLRIGIVSLCRNNAAVAVESFKQAQQHAANGEIRERLNVLIRAAQKGEGVIPGDCTATSTVRSQSEKERRVALALSLGMIHHLVGRHAVASGYFERVTGSPGFPGDSASPARRAMPGATPAQRAFAAFGTGAVLQAQSPQEIEKAHAALLASVRAYPEGSWHDETLYRIATLIESQAQAQFGGDEEARDPKRMASLQKARAQALPHWQQLIERYPESPRVEQAHYHAGVLLSEQAHAASAVAAAGDRRAAARIDQALKDAADTFKRITEEFPKSPYAGDAYVRQIDIVLEWMFDLDKAIAITEKAIAWVKQVKPEQSPSTLGELPAWAMTAGRSHNISINQHAFEIYVKAGLVAHLQGRNDQAIAMFREANKFDPSLRRQSDAETAMDRMISVVQGHRPSLSPQELLDKLRQEQRTAVLLADLALLTFDPQRAESLYDRLLTGQSPFPAPSTELEAYLLLRMGQALEYQRRHEEAMAVLQRLYDPKYSRYPWAADGIFRIGTWSHNATQDLNAGMAHWRHIFTRYPDHPEAERSLFYFGLNAARSGNHQDAVDAYSEYLKRYPDSRWTQRIRERELPEAIRLSQETER